MNQATTPTSTGSRRRLWVLIVLALLMAIASLPWVLAKTSLRDRLLNAIVASDDVTLSTSNASLGYITPLSVSGLQVRSRDQLSRIDIEHIQAEQSWLGLLLSRPELGTFRFQNPHVDVTVDPAKIRGREQDTVTSVATSTPRPVDLSLPNFAASIENASVVVRTPNSAKPPIDLDQMNVTLRVQNVSGRSMLQIDPSTVFDHQRITPELCGQGLQLVAPLLADEVAAEGAFSLRIKQFQIPIGGDQQSRQQDINIEGELQLHEANVGLRNTIAKAITDVVMKLIGVSTDQRLTVARDLVVKFQVVEGRVRHEGLALLLPHGDSSIVLTSSGSVGLDESLDLTVAVKLPDQLLGGGPFVQRLTKTPIALAITGTMKQPDVRLASTDGLVGSIREMIQGNSDPNSPSPAVPSPEAMSEAVDAVGDLLGGIRERVEERRESGEGGGLLPNLRNRMRDRSRRRNGQPGENLTPETTNRETEPSPPVELNEPAPTDADSPAPYSPAAVPPPPDPQLPGEPEPIDI